MVNNHANNKEVIGMLAFYYYFVDIFQIVDFYLKFKKF